LSHQEQFDGLRTVLVNTRNPLNLGAAARAMSNFGFFRLRVVNPYEVAFREARSAVDAAPLLAKAEEFKSVAEAVADCTLVVGTTAASRRELQHPIRSLKQGAQLIRKRLASGPVALLFGSEKRGLSNEDLSQCHWLLRIPTQEEHRSMNLGQAIAVCMYELARDPKVARPEKILAATAGDLERVSSILLEVLRLSGYLKVPSNKPSGRLINPTEDKIYRFVRRLNPSAEDAQILLGMLRQTLWGLQSACGAKPRE